MSDNDAEGALLELASSLVDEVAAARLVLASNGSAPPVPRAGKVLPAIRQDKRWCAYCGASGKSAKLVPGPDKDWLGDQADHFCADEKACISLNRARHGEEEPAPVPAAPAAPEPAQEPAQSPEVPVNEFAAYGGWYDHLGQFHPPALPQFDAYSHTLMRPENRSHLLSGQARPHYYGGPNYVPPGMLSGAELLEGSGDTPAPEASEEELERRGLHEAARSGGKGTDLQLQQPELPEAAVQRRSRQRPQRDRYGRRRPLRYQGRR
jgi:hypothetical protein